MPDGVATFRTLRAWGWEFFVNQPEGGYIGHDLFPGPMTSVATTLTPK
ncbi:hypothetical protein LWC34_03305 [Kibdelosporangium philippinense]|uniref:Uncharacterized protein n=1 Tax=Kibdelosporangium philippinense TaxID=211113 RepID=A0ABS8Z3D1_9PSEU|nr:hypothetical protein [Kibdelosporangium philippinense]MCE7001867.1 hypothetical protein [Kibdelosporangium philippinense]